MAISVLGGCETTERRSAPQRSTITSSTTLTSTGPASVPLYEQFEAQNSDGPNGKPINATLAGTNYRNSTGMWVGCSGRPATTTYRLRGMFARLKAVAGLQPHTPAELAVKATVAVNGNVVKVFTIRRTDTERIDLDVSGADSLVVTAIAADNSRCTTSQTPYGALGDAMLTPIGL
ncbi:NPCBM/NEW2 domain-containing protein [Mycobacterium intermedium]|nr:NPCBM/NEW2 domain-containing protein [Mycobacterium intermedium]MCV6966733.1 NPCBM/NEW2 domain-containing protein [Mycobacterium intermedium]ODQ99198.1 hypothetical protein BHQ20_18590 [Mycobacterium intermedium]OPE51380.1 hypothetical protein BV508_06835 [Mycobacterium intermedium]